MQNNNICIAKLTHYTPVLLFTANFKGDSDLNSVRVNRKCRHDCDLSPILYVNCSMYANELCHFHPFPVVKCKILNGDLGKIK